jgi:hypothetical protein
LQRLVHRLAGHARAERFWEGRGYREVRRREGVVMGRRTNVIRVMAKPLQGQSLDDYYALVPRDRDPADVIRALEMRRTQALVEKNLELADRMHAPEYRLITPAGKAFDKAGASVLGVSADPLPAIEKFRDKHKLTIALGTDENHEMLEAYGAWGKKSMYGKTFMGIIRMTVLIGPDGRIARADQAEGGDTGGGKDEARPIDGHCQERRD